MRSSERFGKGRGLFRGGREAAPRLCVVNVSLPNFVRRTNVQVVGGQRLSPNVSRLVSSSPREREKEGERYWRQGYTYILIIDKEGGICASNFLQQSWSKGPLRGASDFSMTTILTGKQAERMRPTSQQIKCKRPGRICKREDRTNSLPCLGVFSEEIKDGH